ncbi:IS30 family transposase [Propionivibrio sp.]|uniref:IS30 family transposase n=1 Tax=Propionivibrio sp. TaxID=2212460 RepID=UPI0025ECA068|nr:IS30 family transposase [Propionivibrio sp.]
MYTHRTQDERYQIAILNKAGHDQSEIARVMNRHPSTISRELRRNRGQRGYRPKQAHEFSQARMRACENGPRVAVETWAVVEAKLADTWSPEQISGHLKANKQPTVSHEAIYQRIYADKRAGGTLHRSLRCQKARRKRYGRRERRGTIPNQVSIDLRPTIVGERGRFGDWEGDLVIGAGQKQALVTLNERTSRYSLIAHVPFKTAQAVSDAMISLLTPFCGLCSTID